VKFKEYVAHVKTLLVQKPKPSEHPVTVWFKIPPQHSIGKWSSRYWDKTNNFDSR